MSEVVYCGKNQEQPRKENCESARTRKSTSQPKSREPTQKRCHENIWNGKRLDAAVGSAQVPVTCPGEDDAAKSRPSKTCWMLTHFGNRPLLFLHHSNHLPRARNI